MFENYKTVKELRLRKAEESQLVQRIQSEWGAGAVENADRWHEVRLRSGDVRAVVYLGGASSQQPLWIDRGLKTLCPTVYAVWERPLKIARWAIHRELLPILQRGADFMVPGLAEPPTPPFSVGSVVALTVHGRPVALAEALLSHRAPEFASRRGRAAKILHMIGDTVWNMGSKVLSESEVPSEASSPSCNEKEPSPSALVGEESPTIEADDDEDSPIHNPPPGSKEPSPSSETISAEVMDDRLKVALAGALLHIAPGRLPLSIGQLYSSEMRARSKEALDFGPSSYHQCAKFMKAMAKAGWMEVAPKQGELCLISVHRSHEEVVEFGRRAARPSSASAAPSSASSSPVSPSEFAIVAESRLSVPSEAEFLWTEDALGELERYAYSRRVERYAVAPSAARSTLLAYALREGLDRGATVVLNEQLKRLLAPKGETSPTVEWPKQQAVEALYKALPPILRVQVGEHVLFGPKSKFEVRLSTQKRQGNKVVTIVEGLDRLGLDPNHLAASWRSELAASISLDHSNSSADHSLCLFIQGNHIKSIRKRLLSLGFPDSILKS